MISKMRVFCLLLSLLSCISAFAQIGIALSLNRQTYMQYEHIFACVTLRNDTGKPLLFGKDPSLQGFVLFDIRDEIDRPVPQRPGADLSVTGLYLSPGEVKRMVLPLHKYYDITKIGHYTVHAFVSHNLLPHEYRSKNLHFNISGGVKAWEKTVGVPDVDDGKKVSALPRTYSLLMVTDGSYTCYYLKVEDEKRVYGVSRVGQLVGYERFQAEVDMLSRIHLLMPISPRVFHYLSFSVDGTPLDNSYWKSGETIPMLYRDSKTGRVTRIGGVVARPKIDFRDPKEGKMTISDIMTDQAPKEPKAPKERGVVDLGKGMMPTPGEGMKREDED